MNLRKLVSDILPVARHLAQSTATTIDDAACDLLQLVIDNEDVANWLQSLFDGGLKADNCAAVSTPSDTVMAALRDRKIDWAKLVKTLPQVLKIVALFV